MDSFRLICYRCSPAPLPSVSLCGLSLSPSVCLSACVPLRTAINRIGCGGEGLLRTVFLLILLHLHRLPFPLLLLLVFSFSLSIHPPLHPFPPPPHSFPTYLRRAPSCTSKHKKHPNKQTPTPPLYFITPAPIPLFPSSSLPKTLTHSPYDYFFSSSPTLFVLITMVKILPTLLALSASLTVVLGHKQGHGFNVLEKRATAPPTPTATGSAAAPEPSGCPAYAPIATGAWPALDCIPYPQDPQVQQWLKLVDMTKVPVFPLSNDGVCPPAGTVIPADQCWWTCQKCTAPADVTYCPQVDTWGLTYDGNSLCGIKNKEWRGGKRQ